MKLGFHLRDEGEDYCLDCKYLLPSLDLDYGIEKFMCPGRFIEPQTWYSLHNQRLYTGHSCSEFNRKDME